MRKCAIVYAHRSTQSTCSYSSRPWCIVHIILNTDMRMGACQNLPKRVYIFLNAFREKPKSHLNAWPGSIFFSDIKVYIFYVGQKNIERAGALLIFLAPSQYSLSTFIRRPKVDK